MEWNPAAAEVISFGDIRIDAAAHRLYCNGADQAIEPKAFAVLLALVRRPGQVLERDEILDLVWGHRHVTPGVLTRVIAQIRHALADHADAPRYIQTVHTLGYRFIGTLTAVTQALPATPAAAASSKDCYALGRRYWSERNKASIEIGLRHFREAIAADPGNARAWCGIADSHLLLYEYGDLPADTAIREARRATAQAHALQPELAEAYASQGLLEVELQHFPLAICLLELAVQLDPALPHARAWLAMALTLDGRLRAARHLIDDALPHDPSDFVLLTALSMNLAMRGRFSGAEQVLEEVCQLNPTYLETYWQLAWVRAQHGCLLAAVQALREAPALALAPGNGWTQHCLARLALMAGQPAPAAEAIAGLPAAVAAEFWNIRVECCWAEGRWSDAVELLARLQPRQVDRARHASMLAHSLAGCGRRNEALTHYESAYPGDPKAGDSAIRPWDLNLGLGERANQVALLDAQNPRRAPTLAGLQAQLSRLRNGGVRLPALDYHCALLSALRGEPEDSLHWLDQALDAGFADAQAFKRELAWQDFPDPGALGERRLRLERLVANERSLMQT